MKQRIPVMLVLVMLTLLVGFGFVRSFRLEQAGGKFYGIGSSLRADREGTKILHDTLKEMPGVEVVRNASPLEDLLEELDPETTLILQLNSPRPPWREQEDLEDYLHRGGRLLLTPPRLIGGLGDQVFEEMEADEEEAEEQQCGCPLKGMPDTP